MVTFSCYPKIDGTGFIFDPSGKMTQDSTKALSVELEKKVRNYIISVNLNINSYNLIESRFVLSPCLCKKSLSL